MTTLTLERVSMAYDATAHAVVDASFTVDDGAFMVLVGPSGGGKTTTLRLIAGLLTPTQGDIRIDGESVLTTPPEKRGAALVSQQHSLFPFRTVGENVAYGLTIRKVPKAERAVRVADALALVHLAGFESRWPNELSGGQRQRVALARALVIRPRLLLLDEPLSNLDHDLRVELQNTIGELHRTNGLTTVMVTHDQHEASALADSVAVMIDGSIRQIGSPAEIVANPSDDDVARSFGSVLS